MSKRKDISDLFRESEKKFRPKPSANAWERLENRLDHNSSVVKSNGTAIYRRLAMAAALVLLVTFVALLPSYLNKDTRSQMAFNEVESAVLVEEIRSSDYAGSMARPLAMSETYSNVSLEEGTSEKRLTVAIRNSGRLNQAPEYPSTETLIAEAEQPEELEEPNYVEPAPDENAGMSDMAADIPAEYEAVEYAEADDILVYEPEAAKESAASKRAVEESIPAPAPEAPSVTGMDAASNVITYDTDYLEPEVQQFQWLIGQWSTDEGLGKSVENWEVEDAFTIQGKGVLRLNGEETFVETMAIKKIGQQLYFITVTDEEGQERYFRLTSYEAGVAVFEDEENKEFPQQIIIEQEGPDSYQATFSEDQEENMTTTQQNYLQNRNYVQPDRAVRNMSRIGNKE